MAGKVRVSAIAKELGQSSKDVIAKLGELGEFVKSASSTIEAPVVRKLYAAFPATGGSAPAPDGGVDGSGRKAAAKPAPSGGDGAATAPASPEPTAAQTAAISAELAGVASSSAEISAQKR